MSKAKSDTKKTSGLKRNALREEKPIKITFEALMKILLSAYPDEDIPVGRTEDNTIVYLAIETGYPIDGYCFYDFEHRIAFNMSENWRDTFEAFAEYIVDERKFLDQDKVPKSEELEARHQDLFSDEAYKLEHGEILDRWQDEDLSSSITNLRI